MSRTATASGGFRTDLATPAARPWPLILANRSRTSFFFVTKIFKKIPRARKCTSITNGPWIPADIHQILKCSKILQRHKQNLRRWSLRSCCRSGSRHCTGPGAAFSASFLTADRRLRESVARVAAHIVSHSALAANWRNKFQCAERVATLSRKLTDKLNNLFQENIHRNS